MAQPESTSGLIVIGIDRSLSSAPQRSLYVRSESEESPRCSCRASESGFSWHMVRETGEGKRKGSGREGEGRVHYDRRIIIQSLNALGDVSCQNAYKIQLCASGRRKGTKCERGYSGHLCRDRHLPDSSREMHCRCQESRGEPLSKAVHVVMES